MSRAVIICLAFLACQAVSQNSECKMRLDEAAIDLHGFLRAFYSCSGLGRSFVMDHNVQRPLPSYANFSYGRNNYAAILKEVLAPLGLKLQQGKFVDAIIVLLPAAPAAIAPPPLMGAGGQGGGAVDSSGVAADTLPVPVLEKFAEPAKAPRRFRASASGLLKSSARRMGLEYNELLIEASPSGVNRLKGKPKVNQLWHIAARASDSLGSINFARIVDFVAFDTSKVVFGSETRRVDSDLSNFGGAGSVLTQYTSVFDGLSVDVKGEQWSFVWRGNGSTLEVPGVVGSCASGSSAVKFEGRSGVPWLGNIPVLGYLFSFESKYDDELLISVCLEEKKDEL